MNSSTRLAITIFGETVCVWHQEQSPILKMREGYMCAGQLVFLSQIGSPFQVAWILKQFLQTQVNGEKAMKAFLETPFMQEEEFMDLSLNLLSLLD